MEAADPQSKRAQARPRWKTAARWTVEDTFALEALRPLGGGFLPWTGYALSPASMLQVLAEAELYNSRVIVELGAGLSTVFLARYLHQCRGPDTRLISVDNDREWLEMIRRYLEREKLLHTVDLVHARRETWTEGIGLAPEESVEPWQFEPPVKWYAAESIRGALGDDEIDLLLVDGPRGSGTISRYPALVALAPHLAAQPTVILDDAQRAPEMEVLARWAARSDLEFTQQPGTRLAIGRRKLV